MTRPQQKRQSATRPPPPDDGQRAPKRRKAAAPALEHVDTLTPDERREVEAACAAGVVARLVADAMLAKHLSAAALRDASGVGTETIASLLAARAVPSASDLDAVASALGTTALALARPDAYMSGEVAALSGVTSRTVVQWVRKGRLPGRCGENGRYWVDAEHVRALAGGRPPAERGGKAPYAPKTDLGIKIFAAMRRRTPIMTQLELTAASGVSQSRLSTIIRGLSSPAVDQLTAIASGLGVKVAYLVEPATDEDRAIVAEALKQAA